MTPITEETKTATGRRVFKRPADERGLADHGWLHARFTFSFADYFDPDHMGFKSLRVMNNDTIQPGGGFPMHPHDNMEIFTYIIEGQLEHKDNMGNGAVISAGNLQYMSAGDGVRHSEFNPSRDEQTLLYQIWLRPNVQGGEPRYAEKPLGEAVTPDSLRLLFSGDGREGSTAIRQDAEISFGHVSKGKEIAVPSSDTAPHVWIQVVSGEVSVFGETLKTGDGLAIENMPEEFPVAGVSPENRIIVFRLA